MFKIFVILAMMPLVEGCRPDGIRQQQDQNHQKKQTEKQKAEGEKELKLGLEERRKEQKVEEEKKVVEEVEEEAQQKGQQNTENLVENSLFLSTVEKEAITCYLDTVGKDLDIILNEYEARSKWLAFYDLNNNNTSNSEVLKSNLLDHSRFKELLKENPNFCFIFSLGKTVSVMASMNGEQNIQPQPMGVCTIMGVFDLLEDITAAAKKFLLTYLQHPNLDVNALAVIKQQTTIFHIMVRSFNSTELPEDLFTKLVKKATPETLKREEGRMKRTILEQLVVFHNQELETVKKWAPILLDKEYSSETVKKYKDIVANKAQFEYNEAKKEEWKAIEKLALAAEDRLSK